MPLVASCDALYYPEQPLDNVIGLHWEADEGESERRSSVSAPEPSTSLVFKVKSTAPQLFHVRPHYGALLLADPAAMATAKHLQSTTLQFGLRSNYEAAADGGGGGGGGGGGLGTSPGDAATVATRRTAPYSGDSPSAARPQERFVIDYTVVSSEPLAYQQIAQALHDPAKLTEVVKSIWALISSGAVTRSHVGPRRGIGLNVYMSKVFLSEADAASEASASDAAGRPVIVPPNAKLIPCSLIDRTSGSGSGNGNSPSRATQRVLSPSTASSASAAVSPAKKGGGGGGGGDAMRLLKEEVKALRQEARSPQDSSSRNVTPNNNSSSPLRTLPEAASSAGKPSFEGQGDADDDILMKVNLDPDAAGLSVDGKPRKKKGVKLYLLLAIMFAVYVLCLFMRRGGEGSAVLGKESGSNAAQSASHDL